MALTSVSYSTGTGSGFGLTPQRKLTSLSGLPSAGSTGAAGGSSSLAAALAPNKAYGALNPGTTTPKTVAATVAPNTGYGMLNPGTTLPGTTTPKPPVATSQQQQQPGTAASPPPSPDADPVSAALAQITQAGGRDDAQARAAAAAAKQQLLVNLGDAGLAGTLGLGPTVAGVAGQNPNSTFAQLALGHQQNQGTIDQNAALKNIYFGSVHANQLADELSRYQQAQYGADQQAQQQIGQIDQTLAQALAASRDKIMQAQLAAAQSQMANGSTPATPATDPAATQQTPPAGNTGGGTPQSGASGFAAPVVSPLALALRSAPLQRQIAQRI